MLGNAPVVGAVVHEMAKNGSPALLTVAGRAIGLGTDDQQALVEGRLPFWFWVALGIAGGFALHSYWPEIKGFVTKKSED